MNLILIVAVCTLRHERHARHECTQRTAPDLINVLQLAF
jgi:hypothetical protein